MDLEERMRIITDDIKYIAKRTNTKPSQVLDIYNIAYEKLHKKYTEKINKKIIGGEKVKIYNPEKEEQVFFDALRLAGRYMRRYYEK